MNKAYSYLRFSRPEQAKGDSIRRQIENRDLFVQQNKLVLDTSLTLHDCGVSGFRGKNAKVGHLAAFLRLVEQGRIERGSYLLVENIDRISRQEPWEAFKIIQKLVDAGIRIVTTMDKTEYSTATIDKVPYLLEMLWGGMRRAHDTSKYQSERIAASYVGRREKANRGEAVSMGRPPRWIEWDGTKFQFNEAHAKTVRRMISMAMQGIGSNRIAQTLNREKVAMFTESDAKTWGAPTVIHVLKTRRLIGEYQPCTKLNGKKVPQGEPIKGFYPALISEQNFYALQGILGTRSQKRGAVGKYCTNVFGDKLKCGFDDTRMTLTQKKKKAAEAPVSILISHNMMKGITPRCGVSYDQFEHHFLNWMVEVDLKKDKKPDTTEFMEGQIAELKGRANTLKSRLAKSGGDFASGLDLLESIDKQIAEKRKEIDTAKAKQEKPKFDTTEVKKLLAAMENSSGDERYAMRQRLRLAISDVLDHATIFPYGQLNGIRIAFVVAVLKDQSYRSMMIVYHRKWKDSFSSEQIERSAPINPNVDWQGLRKIYDEEAAMIMAGEWDTAGDFNKFWKKELKCKAIA